jgi:hypothetical protein
LSLGTIQTVNLLKYASENRSSPRIVTGKWLLKNSILTIHLKNKTWASPQIKHHKKHHKLKLIRPQTQHKNPEYTYLNFLIPLEEKIQIFCMGSSKFINQAIKMCY